MIVLCAGPRQRRNPWCCAASYFAVDNLLKNRYSYWFDKSWFHTEGKLLLGYIKPSSWGLPTSKYVLHHPTRGLGVAKGGLAPYPCVGPLGDSSRRPFACLFPRRKNPKYPSHIPRKVPEAPPSSTLAREGPEPLPGTLPERGIITGGLYIIMPASGVMRE